MTETRWVGKEVKRIDAEDKVRGTLKYMGDLSFPNMIYGAVLRDVYKRQCVRPVPGAG